MAHKDMSDGLRLLRCINDTQAQGREGARVDPPRAAQQIGLRVGSKRYHDALSASVFLDGRDTRLIQDITIEDLLEVVEETQRLVLRRG